MRETWLSLGVCALLLMTAGAPAASAQDEVTEGEIYEGEAPAVEEAPVEDPGQAPAVVAPPARPIRPAQPTRAPITPRLPRPPQPRQPGPTEGLVVNGNSAGEKANGVQPGEEITFNCENCELISVIKQLAAATGRNFDIDPNIGATPVTIISHKPIPGALAFELLESILTQRGFSMTQTLEGNLTLIRATQEATNSAKIVVRMGTEVPEGFDLLSTHIVQIQYANAEDVAGALQLLGSANARIDTYAPTNTLIVTDTADGLRRMFSFLAQIDLPGNETGMEIFILEYTRAETIQTQIEQVLLDASGAPQIQNPNQPQPRPQPQPTRPTRAIRPTVPGQTPSQVFGSKEETLRMVPDERLNALIVVATRGMMEQVRDLIKRLDTPTPYESNNLHIYELLNADAEQVETALQGVIGGVTARREAEGGGGGGAAPVQQSAEVTPFEQKVQVTRYDQTNSLLIVASPQDYKILQEFISRLDVPQRQVQVDALIMRVATSNDFSLAVDAAGITGNDGFGVSNTANILQLFETVAGTANQITGGPAAALAGGLLSLGAQGSFTAGVFDSITVNVDGTDVKVPFVPVLLQALENLTELEVLSQPSLVTIDNEEASIVVGQEVPFVTGGSRPQTANDGQLIGTGFTRVEREEVGVKLTVTPQISEGDYVALQLEIEKSNVAANQIGDVNIVGPTTDKSLVTNKVVVKDGSTAIIAGLIEDSVNRTRRQSPILGDLPVLGALFGRRSNLQSKSNIVILITPHIIKEGIDLDRVTEYKIKEYQDVRLDYLFEGDFFYKIRRKHDDRKNNRPTFNRLDEYTGTGGVRNFGRGDVRR